MPTQQEIRSIRLKYDYKEMCNIRGPIISWRAVRGAPPYAEEYHLTVNLRSIIGREPEYREQHVISLNLPAGYPNVPPLAVMLSPPVVFHPNWWVGDKHWCSGSEWDFSEGLGHFVIRMLRTLQFDPIITNPASPANMLAADWYLENLNKGIFPCDRQTLPDPTRSKFEPDSGVKKRFEILR